MTQPQAPEELAGFLLYLWCPDVATHRECGQGHQLADRDAKWQECLTTARQMIE